MHRIFLTLAASTLALVGLVASDRTAGSPPLAARAVAALAALAPAAPSSAATVATAPEEVTLDLFARLNAERRAAGGTFYAAQTFLD